MEKITTSEKETKGLAKDLVRDLQFPTIIALYGDLGSGKTTFVTGLAEGLGIKHRILSPTFVIERIYPFGNKKELHHLDLYRLDSSSQVDFLDLDFLFKNKNNFVVIEWPEKIEELLPKDTLKINFQHLKDNQRKIILPEILNI